MRDASASDSTEMILTCPECSTSYFVEDAQIGDGRTVRCASCGASWRASKTADLELTVSPDEGAVASARRAEPEDAALFETSISELPAEALPKAFRAKAQIEKRVHEAVTQGAVWAGLGAAVALLLGGAAVFRVDVVRIWPRAASAYAAVGLSVNSIGLTIEDVHAQPSLQDGKPALAVSGVLRNIRSKPVLAPPLRIALLDKHGKRLTVRTAAPGDPLIPGGQTRSFAISLVNPPSSASDLEVTFQTGATARAAPRVVHAPAPQLRPVSGAPEPPTAPAASALAGSIQPAASVVDAEPLPQNSPYALKSPG